MDPKPNHPEDNRPSGSTRADPSPNPKLSHLEEYKALRDEIMLYQQEMHRTWLWAIIPAAAVYTWLSLQVSHLSNVPPGVWFIPTAFVLLCSVRYGVFWYRIDRLAKYQCLLEEHAFGDNPENRCGVARWNRKHSKLGVLS
jgi:hypothetical protein